MRLRAEGLDLAKPIVVIQKGTIAKQKYNLSIVVGAFRGNRTPSLRPGTVLFVTTGWPSAQHLAIDKWQATPPQGACHM